MLVFDPFDHLLGCGLDFAINQKPVWSILQFRNAHKSSLTTKSTIVVFQNFPLTTKDPSYQERIFDKQQVMVMTDKTQGFVCPLVHKLHLRSHFTFPFPSGPVCPRPIPTSHLRRLFKDGCAGGAGCRMIWWIMPIIQSADILPLFASHSQRSKTQEKNCPKNPQIHMAPFVLSCPTWLRGFQSLCWAEHGLRHASFFVSHHLWV